MPGRASPGSVAGLAVLGGGAVLAVPALGHQTAHGTRSAHATASTTSGLADLPVKKATMTCAALAAGTHTVAGLSVSIAQDTTGAAASGDPEYCALTGHIAKYIGFEVVMPMTTWRERYLQVGCGGLCGSIGLNAPQSTGFKALANGYFIVASQDEGHFGQSNDWSTNSTQRVDFAYLSDHDLALVVNGLAAKLSKMWPSLPGRGRRLRIAPSAC